MLSSMPKENTVMDVDQQDSRLTRILQKLAFLKDSIPSVIVWPILSLVLAALVWGLTFAKFAEDKRSLEKNAYKDAASLSSAYAQHMTRAIEQVDQVSLLLKFEWERLHGKVALEGLLQKGIFPTSSFKVVAISDKNGVTKTFTPPFKNQTSLSVANKAYFTFHRNEKSSVLFIGEPVAGINPNSTVIQFSRRLETVTGDFDGVIAIAVDSSYFSAPFYDGLGLGKSGFLAAIDTRDKEQRSFRMGGAMVAPGNRNLRAVPEFNMEKGTMYLPGEPWFSDRKARLTAWEALDNYPFIAMVGLSEEELLVPYKDAWRTYEMNAIAASILLLLFALIAMALAARLAWRKHLEEDARSAYRIATEGGNDGFYMLRAIRKRGVIEDLELIDCNEQGAAFYGSTREEFLGTKLSERYSGPYFRVLMGIYRRAIELGFYEDELKIDSNSPLQLGWIHRRFVRSATGLAMTVKDITQAKTHEHELSRLANEDALTALPNRHWLNNYLPAALERMVKHNQMLALLFIDLDDFKNVNDTLGHQAGDSLLCEVADRLRAVLRPGDYVVRLGGDEFTVILEAVESNNDAADVAARISDSLKQPFQLLRRKSTIGASIGITMFPRDGADAGALLKNSDIAMYHAKAEGKGDFRFYQPVLYENLKVRLDTERALLKALDQNQFVLYYEPRICTFTGQLRALEALVRWMHPQRGLVSPSEFIPLAEDTGLILKLGEIVVEQAFAQIVQWKKLGLPLVPVSINVSARQFNHGDVKSLFSSALKRHDIHPELIEIELTESSMMGEQSEVIEQLAAIRSLGIKLLVDDFGTGFSSLAQLQRLNMDALKVDRTFTAELIRTTEGEIFFKAIVSMAHSLGMSVIAEGVETVAQLHLLRALSCDEIQGYFIAKPMPASDIHAILRKRLLLESGLLNVSAKSIQ